MLAAIGTVIAGSCALAAALAAGGLRLRSRRKHRRRVQAARRLEQVVNELWYPAAHSFESPGTALAFQLRSLGQATMEIARALAKFEDGTGLVAEWTGLPFKPVALERADRAGPPELWRRFDRAFESFWLLEHPLDDGLELANATMALADWNEHNGPGPRTEEPPPRAAEASGAGAAFFHAVAAPCLAGLAAGHAVRQEGDLLLNHEALAADVNDAGSEAQRTMLALAFALGPGALDADALCPDALCAAEREGGPTIGELLALEDTDLCHALEAVALARRLRRVYPAQRPELLWVDAELAEGDG